MAKGADRPGKKNSGRNGNVPPASSRWKPGQSGNPKGRAKRSVSLMARLEARLREEILNGDKDLADAVVDSMVRAILKDPVKAWPMLREFIRWDKGPVAGPVGEGEVIVSERPKPDYEGFAERLRRMANAAEATALPEGSPSA